MLQLQSTSENRTFGFQTAPKSKRSIVGDRPVRISKVWFVRTFGFRTLYIKIPNISEIRTLERSCSAFGRKFASEIRTKCSDFGRFRLFELNLNQMMGRCLKSEHVRIWDGYCNLLSICERSHIQGWLLKKKIAVYLVYWRRCCSLWTWSVKSTECRLSDASLG